MQLAASPSSAVYRPLVSLISVAPRLLHDRLRRRPRNALTRNGYEVVPEFLPSAECLRLIGLADEILAGRPLCGDARVVNTAPVDTKVTRLVNLQDIDEGLSSLMPSIEAMFTQRLGEPVRMRSVTIQVDDPDTDTKRGWHVDVVAHEIFKAFVYLNDVSCCEDGPLAVIPGSHRHIVRKLLNVTANTALHRSLTDMRHFYNGGQVFLEPRGTLILSNQTMVHKGWNEHSGTRRYCLICYLAFARYSTGAPL